MEKRERLDQQYEVALTNYTDDVTPTERLKALEAPAARRSEHGCYQLDHTRKC